MLRASSGHNPGGGELCCINLPTTLLIHDSKNFRFRFQEKENLRELLGQRKPLETPETF